MSTDALETLGTIIDVNAGRDAIHLAVEPVVAAERLHAGQHVGFVEGGVGTCDKPLGIVDPFLTTPVHPGERFWLVVYPRQITSLRHVWQHPSFPDKAVSALAKEDSEEWLRNFIRDSSCPEYEVLIALARGEKVQAPGYGESYIDDNYMHFAGWDAHGDIPREFWDHVENVTGKKIPDDKRARHFSCSC